jgi:exosortase/archaeosortase family protein
MQKIIKFLKENETIRFLLFFSLGSVLLSNFFYFYIGLVPKENYYNQWLDEHFNFIVWYRYSILWMADKLETIAGYKVLIIGTQYLKMVNGFKVNLAYDCLGMGVNSVWIAFIIAYPKAYRKTLWLLLGLVFIWFINSIRIAILLNQTNISGINKTAHHDVFNFILYIIVVLMMYWYTVQKRLKT